MSMAVSKPLVAIAALALVSGAAVLLRPSTHRADMEVWTFAEPHARSFREAGDGPALVTLWEQQTRQSVRVVLIGGRGIDIRLISLFNSGRSGRDVPDLVEVEIGSVGKYFRAPADQVGFLPLNDFLDRPGPDGRTMRQRLIPGRLAPWTKDGIVFGIPHDVHPVTITYRKDLWDQAGIDPSAAVTWEQFRAMCVEFNRYWREHGQPRRRAMELSPTSADSLTMMLLQRRVNLLEGSGFRVQGSAKETGTGSVSSGDRVMLADPKVVATLAFYARFVAGADASAGPASPGRGAYTRDLADGDTCAMLTPDWKAGVIRDFAREYAPDLAGKLRMMPLPKFETTDHATSTWGGTMAGIPRRCANPEASWKLLEFLYFSPEALAARRRHGGIVPPLLSPSPLQGEGRGEGRSAESEATPGLADALPAGLPHSVPFTGDETYALYVRLARDVPAVCVTPFTTMAQIHLARVLSRAVAHLNAHGDAGLETQCRRWLEESAAELSRRIEFGELP